MKSFLDFAKQKENDELKRQVDHLKNMADEHKEKAEAALMMGDRDGHALHMSKNNHFETQHDTLKSKMSESIEQIDELDTGTLKRYTKKSLSQTMSSAKKGDMKTSNKRFAGMSKSLDRIKTREPMDTSRSLKNITKNWHKEEVEQIDEKSAAWQRKEGKSESGGLNRKGIASYRKQNPGSKLSMAVTTKPSKLKPGSKAANRRKSFCARMSGMKKRLTSAKTAKDPNSRINKSLRKWNC